MARRIAPKHSKDLTKPQERWLGQIKRTVGLLSGLETMNHPAGERWATGMRRYYGDWLKRMLDNPPQGMEEQAKRIRKTLSDSGVDL